MNRDRPIGVAIVGCGHWGQNLIRNFSEIDSARVLGFCRADPEKLRAMAADHPEARLYPTLTDVLADGDVEAVVIATPAPTHYALAREALEAGRHVFVEKLSGRFSECKALVVVVTPALYQSRACLAEISAALDAGVRVVPVLFENPIPTAREQWPMIDKHDSDGKLMLLKVQKDFARLNTVPAPPGDIRSQPQAIGRVVGLVASVAGGAAAGAQQYFEQGARSQEGIEHRRWQPAPAVAAAAALAAVVPPAAAAAAAGAVGVDCVAGGGGGEGERAPWARAAILGARR